MAGPSPYTNGVPNPRGRSPFAGLPDYQTYEKYANSKVTGERYLAQEWLKAAGGNINRFAGAPPTAVQGPNPFITDQRGMPVDPAHGAVDVLTGHSSSAVNVKGLIAQLRSAGYDLPAGATTLTPTVLSALRDFVQPSAGHELSPALENRLSGAPITGNRNPAKWNQRFGTASTKSLAFRPNTGPGGALNGQGADVTPQYAGADGTVDLSGPAGLATNVGTKIPLGLANFGKMIDPATADAIAGAQFDPQIAESKLVLSHDPLQALQDTKDINSWYQQALNSLDTAAGRDTAGEQSGIKSIQDATSALVSSLGGSANAGAGLAASAGQNASGTLAAIGAADDQYNNDLSPLIKAEQAEQALSQTNKDKNQQQSDQVALENLQGQRGQALTSAQDQIRQENNALAQARAQESASIRGSNNSLAQQGFSNALSLAQAQIAAMISGLNVQTKSATLDKALHPNAFLNASPTVKDAAYQQALGSLYDPTTKQKMNLTPQQAQTRVSSILAGFGWNPAPGTPVGQFASGILNAWQTAG
jgi:hypothetical protein